MPSTRIEPADSAIADDSPAIVEEYLGRSRPAHLIALSLAGKYWNTGVLLLVMTASFWAASPNAFGTRDNLTAVLTDMAPVAIVAAGLTVCLVTGDFDLSIGYRADIASVLVTGLLNGLGFAGVAVGSLYRSPSPFSLSFVSGCSSAWSTA